VFDNPSPPPGDARSGSGSAIKRQGNPDGALFGEVVVFTGSLEIPRRDAADLAAAVGCEVAQGVTKATTLLVVGDMDVKRALLSRAQTSMTASIPLLLNGGRGSCWSSLPAIRLNTPSRDRIRATSATLPSRAAALGDRPTHHH